MSEEVNRKLPAGKTTVQFLTPNPVRNNAQCYRQTDRQTDDIMMPRAVRTVCLGSLRHFQKIGGLSIDARGSRP